MPQLASARYGKDNIRVYKVQRDSETGFQNVVEMTVTVLLEGEIGVSYTNANNSVIVATDSIKNLVYILAHEHPVTPPELFGSIVATHLIDTYKHIHSACVQVITHRWTRMNVNGEPHPHSFIQDGAEVRKAVTVAKESSGISIQSGIAGLLVLKSTGSDFNGFIQDAYTTLPEVDDRILSTEIDCSWEWNQFTGIKDVEISIPKFDEAWKNARTITLNSFATDVSPSVQNIIYKMAELILAALPDVEKVDYSLPNKHYFEIDLSWHKGIKNTGKDATVYAPQTNPNGLIQCSVSRSRIE